jgi:chromosome partitioning protein
MRNTDGVNILPVEIVERDAYSSMFSLGKGIRQCSSSEVNGLPKAIENAEAFTKAVVARLKENAEEGQS